MPAAPRETADDGNRKQRGQRRGQRRAAQPAAGRGPALFGAATLFYPVSGAPWWLYAALFLAPDLSFLAYLAGPRPGAILYNALHAAIGPLLLGLAYVVMHWPMAGSVALIWLAHIGVDRALGYGPEISVRIWLYPSRPHWAGRLR
jgi:hypothetical protein